jgi:peptide/nickel transport system permease protein
MSIYIIRRLLQAVVVIAAMSILVFAGVFMIGDPAQILISDDADQAERQKLIESLGLDLPFHLQYLRFVGRALHGDLGNSFVFNEPALRLILDRMPATLELAFTALLLAIVIGIPLGMWAGMKPDSLASKSIMAGSILGFSLPTFWVGIMGIMVFAVMLGWLPASGRGTTRDLFGIQVSFLTLNGLEHLILPAVNLALLKISLAIRLTRAGTREVIHQDYVKFARAKGLRPARIIMVHVLKNILIPVITVLGLEFGSLIAFSVVTETVFAWPGMGKLIIDSMNRLDRPVVVAYLLITVCMFITINLVVDILYSMLDPRVRLQDVKG